MQLLIFDCDGVLVDSDRLSLRVQSEELTKLGLPMSPEECMREFLGIGLPATIARVEEKLGRRVPEAWKLQLEQRIFEAFDQELEPVAGIVEALDALTLPVCIASSGSYEKLGRTLTLTGLYERFEGRIFSATEVARGKPAPDLFLHAARELGVAPEACGVVEDSPAGVEAARAAGMRVFAYAAATPADWLAGPRTQVFDDMRNLPELVAAFQDG